MTTRPYVVALIALLMLAGCGSSPTAPQGDWIELNSLTPPGGSGLTAGDTVTFTAVVTCTVVSKDAGHVVLVVVDQGNRALTAPGTQASAALTKGSATITLTATITVPPSGSTVTVALPLFVEGSNVTRAYKQVTYTVP